MLRKGLKPDGKYFLWERNKRSPVQRRLGLELFQVKKKRFETRFEFVTNAFAVCNQCLCLLWTGALLGYFKIKVCESAFLTVWKTLCSCTFVFLRPLQITKEKVIVYDPPPPDVHRSKWLQILL